MITLRTAYAPAAHALILDRMEEALDARTLAAWDMMERQTSPAQRPPFWNTGGHFPRSVAEMI